MVGDKEAQEAMRAVIEWMGYDVRNPAIVDTPRRLLSWLAEFRSGQELGSDLTTFDGIQYDEMVVVTGIPFVSLCEHHMLPFQGTVTIGYIPKDKYGPEDSDGSSTVLGLSKLARLAVWLAKRLQVQERLTTQIRDAVMQATESPDVGVVVTGVHECMTLRGVKAHGANMVTSALAGAFKDNVSTRAEFLALAR